MLPIITLMVVYLIGYLYYEKKFIIYFYIPEKNLYYRKNTTLFNSLEVITHKINFKATINHHKEK